MRGSRGLAAGRFRHHTRRLHVWSHHVLGSATFVLCLLGSADAIPRIESPAAPSVATPSVPERSDKGNDGTIGRGRLLVASRLLQDPNFAETVVLILEGGSTGAVGVVVNRPTDLELRTVLPDVKELNERHDTVFLGGPVDRSQLLLLVRATAAPKDSMRVFGDVFVTASMDALSRAAEERGEEVRFRLFAGYAGWGPGQLDAEIARGDWIVVPGDAERVFATAPERVWSELIERDAGRWVRLDSAPGEWPGERDCGAVIETPTMAPPCKSEPSSSCVR
jgi:putative transcriptional regulator